MLRAALFVIAPNWKQSKCPSTSECINKMWYIHNNGILFWNKEEWTVNTLLQRG